MNVSAPTTLDTRPRPSPQYFRMLNLEITTVCNLACPDCSAGINMGLRRAVHHPWSYFVEAAPWLQGFEELIVIGGEPTSHPDFAEIVPRLRSLFGCKRLVLWTNGFKAREYEALIQSEFDAVYASLYDAHTAPWNKRPNGDLVQFVKDHFEHRTMELPHIPRARRGFGGICERGEHGPILYADGLIYGCCVSQSIAGGRGIKPGPHWRQEILDTPLPCQDCFLSP